MVPHRSTNQARTCLTSLSRREAVLSCWYGRSRIVAKNTSIHIQLKKHMLCLLSHYTKYLYRYNTAVTELPQHTQQQQQQQSSNNNLLTTQTQT